MSRPVLYPLRPVESAAVQVEPNPARITMHVTWRNFILRSIRPYFSEPVHRQTEAGKSNRRKKQPARLRREEIVIQTGG